MITQESIDKVLKEIQLSVPEVLRKSAIIEEDLTPTMKDIVEKALDDPDFPEEKKEQLRTLKENGHFNKKKLKENNKITKQIENYVSRQINKAVKEGRLPTKKQLAELQKQWKKQKDNL